MRDPLRSGACASCGRPRVLCDFDSPKTNRRFTPEELATCTCTREHFVECAFDADCPIHGNVKTATDACSVLGRVLGLERFRESASSFLASEADVSDHAKLSIGTLALMREWRRVEQGSIRDAIAREIAIHLDRDLVEVDLDESIGDRCPKCWLDKSAAEGAKDYWCQSCILASAPHRVDARKENER